MKKLVSGPTGILAVFLFCIFSSALEAQVNVTTYHNDNARTGQNTQETVLTPANVNSSQFGKLFSVTLDGWAYAQPLYLSNVNISGGTHNVLYVATEHDSLYAIDADSGTIYWQAILIAPGGNTVNSSTDLGCGDLVPEVGITGTPVIDTSTGTIYVVAKSKVSGSLVQYLHAIDVTTKAEKFGGPVLIQATVPGTASDGNGTTVSFSPHFENQRAGLLLENGHVVIGWSSHCDISPWHGWIMSYSASTLAQEAAFNTSADGSANGVWMSGGGLAADSNGNIFFATGNGTWNGTTDYGDSIVKLGPPSGGSFPVVDYFTPYNQGSLSGGDTDVASGGLVLLPNLASGQQLLTQMGKEGKMYLIDRNNMGKYCVNKTPPCNGSDTNIVQEIPGATVGVWGTPAYWNGSVYWGGGWDGGGPDNLKAFSFNANNSGLISPSPTSESAKQFSFAAPSPVISANGNSNGILWGLDDSAFGSTCSGGSNCQVLYAYDATNLANMLYNSSQAANNRDVPGGAVKFATPIVANGKVYVGSQLKVSAYGAISSTPTAATPTFSPAPGDYTSTTNVTLSDSTSGATIHCTTDGSTPTAGSPVCGSIAISSTTTLKAIATASGYNPSAIASGIYTIDPGATGINYGAGFTATGLTFNGSAKLNETRLQLTDGGGTEAGSAFISTPINIQAFTTDYSFQLSNANADGFTFTIQGVGATALGPSGGGLGYGPDTPGGTPGIANSAAVKFDIYSNAGEGTDSTGLYTNGASPTTPALDMTSSGVSLLSGDVFNVHTTYDGTTLSMTITDATNSSQTFTASWAINIPGTVGSNSAYVGFTGGTGGLTAIQEILDWTYVAAGEPTAATPTFNPAPGSYNPGQVVALSDTTTGAVIHCTTDGSTPTAGSPVCTSLTLNTTTTIKAIAVANGYNNSAIASGTYTLGGISFVQVSSGPSTIQPSNSSVTVPYGKVQTAGDLNIVVVGWGDSSSTISSVIDSLGNTYSLAVGPTRNSNLQQSIYYAKNVAGGNNTVTVTFNQAVAYPDVRILEYSGLDTSSPLNVTTAAVGSGTSASSGSANTTAPNELIFGAGTCANDFSGAGSGFTNRVINIYGNIGEDKMVSSAGSYAATAINSSGNWVMQMATFKAAASLPAPTVTGVSPNNGPAAGGTAITISGTNFVGGATATLGGTAATNVVVVNSTTITATTAAHAAGLVTVTVTNPDTQNGSLTNGYTYNPAPTVTGVSPNNGPAAGGTAITISGTNFVSGATATLGGTAATNVVVVNSTTITATTAAHAAGVVTVTVTNPDMQNGSLTNGYTYLGTAPTVTGVSPNNGPAAGGTAITISGTNFVGGATATLGGTAATNVVVVNSTTITATTAAHAAGLVTVTVTNPDTQNGSLTNGYTYNPAPTVTGVSPNNGPAAGGTAITISGTNFVSGATATLGGTAATNVVVVNSTTITAKTGAHAAGAVTVTVTNPDTQSGSLTNGYTYTSAINFVQVSSGPSTIQPSNSSVTVPYGKVQTAGDLNIVVVGWGDSSSTISSVIDSLGNTYSLAVGPTRNSNLQQSIYYAKNVAGGNNTVTVTFNQAVAYPDVRILEYSGLDTISPLNVTTAAVGSGTSASSGSANTTAPNELIFGAGTCANDFSGAGSGFTNRVINIYGNIGEDKMVSSAGSYAATAINSSGRWIMQMATFK